MKEGNRRTFIGVVAGAVSGLLPEGILAGKRSQDASCEPDVPDVASMTQYFLSGIETPQPGTAVIKKMGVTCVVFENGLGDCLTETLSEEITPFDLGKVQLHEIAHLLAADDK